VGRVPFMVVWLTLFIFTGSAALFFNRVLQVRTDGYPAWFFPLSLLPALAIGLAAVKFVARAVAKLVTSEGAEPRPARAERSRRRGCQPHAGRQVRRGARPRSRGNELIVHGHLAEDDGKLKQGDKVVLIELDNESGLFHVAALKE